MILVFGKSGQVATALRSFSKNATFLGRSEVNLCDKEACARAINAIRPSAVINAAAYTAVDDAEVDEATALLINGDAPTTMAKTCAQLNIPLVHISTDYVFDGYGKVPWSPNSITNPINAYGRTKLAGELGVCTSGATYAILRTSWVFSETGKNFVKTMLRLSDTRDKLEIIADQIGGPTPAHSIADACVKTAQLLQCNPALSGIYHFSGAPAVSWADFAREIFAKSGRKVHVKDIPTSAYITPAKRPQNSRLDCSNLEVLGLSQPDWRESLEMVFKEMESIDD